ncbi:MULTISPECIES: efflux RND transporter permease subunit [Sphingomonadaceae]|jgi:cobalt-zinc-cadmium resistance protein CzcA|uniref:CusA/CzcA family heavy metal efflux RND transporter n=1 Tax=Novosphingobium silvae TaxID=2692619 RepID=A0A7X4GI66_9SPHN|nr:MULTISPECIES: CusA/CzcA family heavy metal efflux RND transporter [Sphingomonadaceae]MBU64709.1 CusA/CzcA family heavy metal efflux RND transporter [Cupriavidus sp.]MCC4253776.1 CusA/CzcA family heavy metal efflux RND transporter [Sphingobium naphthae]KZC75553.1 cation transporter [Sphingobium yanoikuyae]MDG5973165.1 CusA/CzcA family heavy metal efflux RND transporter [Sphingomonas paucimobilis]MDK8186595.1 CusA/CzcA family heavy metal efflux RND transporter [Sphingomonas zeae]|tara:strand:+ start:119 stop:3352 length:3234 start_codon:yes stop_codon:yes gene_type:complete
MIARILSLSVKMRWLIAFLTLLIIAFGAWQITKLPIDAVPDVTNRQVQISTFAPTLGPVDIEKQVTFPVETALAGIPGLQMTRSFSRNGFSQVTAVFTDSTDIYFARQQVTERLAQAKDSLPVGIQPNLAPLSTGLGEIFFYSVAFRHPDGKGIKTADGRPGWQSDGSYLTPEGERLTTELAKAAYLRTVQDWIIRPQMRTVQGVAGVDSNGGYVKQYLVEPNLNALASYGLSIMELADALERANLSAGSNYVRRAGESFLVRADARLKSIDDIQEAVVATRAGVPVRVRDVGEVVIGGAVRTGSGSRMGSEAVISTILMLVGENSRVVATRVADKLTDINRALPPDVFAEPVYNRSKLVNATIWTVEKNLTEGALLVIVVLFLLLGNIRAALITAAVIPITMLMTASGMNALGVSGNLMSLGALDFGLIVDGAVIIVENALRRLAERQEHQGRLLTLTERMEETREAAQEMVRPTVFGQLIIFLVFVPLLTFEGVEGKTFSPMATTLMLALASAFVLSITFIPAMIAIVVKGRVSETEVKPIRWFKRKYAPMLDNAVARPIPFVASGIAIFAASIFCFGLLGEEFMPQLDEKDITVTNFRVPSASIDQSTQMQLQIENALKTLPEVELVFSKNGNADLGTDPMPPNASDTYVIPKPQSQWPADVKSKEDILRRIEARMKPLIGNRTEIQQPIQMRFNELIAGVRADVAVKLYGDDLDTMSDQARKIAAVLRTIPGAGDVSAEQTDGAPTFDVKIDRQAAARHGLSVEEVANTVAAALGGREAGLLFEGDRRFSVVVRLPDAKRDDLETLGSIPVMLPREGSAIARSIPLREVARFSYTQGLNQISREDGKRMVVVQVNVRGRDLGGFVTEAQQKIGQIDLPPGMYTAWGGTFESLQSARLRLLIVIPICFVAIYALLYMALGGFVPAAIVFSAVPMALAGGVFALLVRGIPFSITAAVGFIALSGVAVLNGLVMMSAIRKHGEEGVAPIDAIVIGAMERVRPVLMTALVASLGFVPMALATGTGAEVQRPLATVVIGGLITSTALTLLVLPAIAALAARWRPRPKPVEVVAAVQPS